MNFKGTIILTKIDGENSKVCVSDLQRTDGVVFNSANELGNFTFTGAFDFSKKDLVISKPIEFTFDKLETDNEYALVCAEFDNIQKRNDYEFISKSGNKIEMTLPVSFLVEFHMGENYSFNIL